MRQLLYTLHGFPGYDIQTRRDIQSTMDIEQFHVTEQCLFSAILAPPQIPMRSLRGPVGESTGDVSLRH
jgi:hypothetical protein